MKKNFHLNQSLFDDNTAISSEIKTLFDLSYVLANSTSWGIFLISPYFFDARFRSSDCCHLDRRFSSTGDKAISPFCLALQPLKKTNSYLQY